jgi:hypothetical protein
MKHADDSAHLFRHALAGVGAGLAGTAVIYAMRSFDERYAPETIPKQKRDPGLSLVRLAERVVPGGPDLPAPVEHGVALALHVVYGAAFGLLFSLFKLALPDETKHPFVFGGIMGVGMWALGHLGLLPLLGLGKPAWKQSGAELAGEVTRHAAYGIATAAAFGTLHDGF